MGAESGVSGSRFGSKYWYALADRGREIRRRNKFWMAGLWSGPKTVERGVTRDFGVDSIEQMQFIP